MSLTKSFIALLILACTSNIYAATPEEALVTCLTDSTTGRDRKDLAMWVFTTLSSHPEVARVMPASDESRTENEKKAGNIFNRLLIEDCRAEVQATQGNTMAIKKAFEYLGKIAMVELLNHQNVKQSMQGISAYIDHHKIQQLFVEDSEPVEEAIID